MITASATEEVAGDCAAAAIAPLAVGPAPEFHYAERARVLNASTMEFSLRTASPASC